MNEEDSNNLKSEKKYQMRIALLERELAEKTRILEKTSSALADSQRQYQNLLKQFKKIKNETEIRHNYNDNNNRYDSDFIFSTMKSRETNSNFGQPLQQLRDFEETIKQLSFQMNRLKSQNNYFQNEQKEWNTFSVSLFNKIKNLLHFCQEFPEDDSEAQRFILDDLFQKISVSYHKKKEEESIYHDKYKQAKAKLCEVQKKCDRMLSLLEESGVDYQICNFGNRKDDINRNHIINHKNIKISNNQKRENLDINALGNHLNQLSTITKQMKKHYETIYDINE